MENKPNFKDLLSKRGDNTKLKEMMNNMIEKSKQRQEQQSEKKRLTKEEVMERIKNHKYKPLKRIAHTYEQKVTYLIREKYSQDAEFAILRQRDTKPEEFEVYNNYCEECKNKVKNGEF